MIFLSQVLNAPGSPPGVLVIRTAPLRLLLINPSNPLVSLANTKASRWNRYRVWKPLGLLTIAGLTPSEWQVSIVDENIRIPDYEQEPKPDLVGITAFTSQAPRAYMLAAEFRRRGIPVVMGGIHATVCPDEALEHVDVLVQGEAESVWTTVLSDFQSGTLQKQGKLPKWPNPRRVRKHATFRLLRRPASRPHRYLAYHWTARGCRA